MTAPADTLACGWITASTVGQDSETGAGGYWIVRARFYDGSGTYLGYSNAQMG